MIEPTMEEFDLANDSIKQELGFEYHPNRLPLPSHVWLDLVWPSVRVLMFHARYFFKYWPAAVDLPSKKVDEHFRLILLWQYAVAMKVENMRLQRGEK